MTTKLDELTTRWSALRNEMWAIEARLKEIKKELPLLENWMTALERAPKELLAKQAAADEGEGEP